MLLYRHHRPKKVHFTDSMQPVCAGPANLNACRTTTIETEVTCKRCLNVLTWRRGIAATHPEER